MAPFSGFPPGRVRFTRIPSPFFTELLPEIDDLDELKVTLYAFWQLDRMEGTFRYLGLEDFSSDEVFMTGINKNEKKALAALKDGLNKAVERGAFLSAEIEFEEGKRTFYFLNTIRGQAAVKAIASGDWQPSGDPAYPIALNLEKPNIFKLYEEHIGPLTPMLADALKEAEVEYPAEWIKEAIRRAVENNVRKWRYVEAILERWQTEGKDDRTNQGHTQKDRKKYVEGEFSDFIEH